MDARKEKIRSWLESLDPKNSFILTPASDDASFRRYFRVRQQETSLIVMDAPPPQEETGTFCHIARRLRAIGLNVPEILAEEQTQGFVLMTDLGTRQYLDVLDNSTVERLYGDALGALVTLQIGTNQQPDSLPHYSRELLTTEMNLFRDWYLEKHLQHQTTAAEHGLMDRAWQTLVDSALQQPQVWVHRDYHSRNLMLVEQHNPGILDFQDAVCGPITYDLVSLLKDCYVEWPAKRVEEWVLGFHARALQSGILKEENEQQFLLWFHRMGIQRHLKVAGIFTRLYHRDGKEGYLNDIPLTLRYLCRALENDPELTELYEFVTKLEGTQSCMQ